jgi:ribosome recycling factor
MDLDDIIIEAEEKMEKALAVFKDALRGMRTGRANPALVENIRVEYYGSPTPLKQIAAIGAPEANMLVVKPFDPSSVSDIEKAIMKSDIGITPSSDGKLIRLVIPPLSEETRRRLVHRSKEQAEEAKVAVRNIRRDANKKTGGFEKTPGVSEDDIENAKEEIQDLVKKFEETIAETLARKTAELMEI